MVSIKIRKHNNITSREKDNKVKGLSELRQVSCECRASKQLSPRHLAAVANSTL